MSKYLFIVNPKAGRGLGRRVLNDLRHRLNGRSDDSDVAETSGPGDASSLAANSGSEVCVAVGGDGTINEVANGLKGSDRVLGVVPAGSGNDFAKSIAVPNSVAGALAILRSGKTRRVDIGSVSCNGGAAGNQSSRLFVNGVGIGFDAAVAAKTREFKRLSGTLLYLAAVFKTLGKYRSPLFDIGVDGAANASRNLLIAIGNGICAGGGFYLTPDARVDDGVLDICLVEEMPVARILRLMPKVMKGLHGSFKGVSFQRGRSIAIHADAPFFVHADGEIVGEGVTGVEVSLKPGFLRVITG